MEDARKRRLSEATSADTGPALKKRGLDLNSDVPNGDASMDSTLDEGLEAFRKEAIWRQMQEYKRQFLRVTDEAIVLKGQLQQAEARALAVISCWDLLVTDLQAILPDTADDIAIHDLRPLWIEGVSVPGLQEALEARFQKTKRIYANLATIEASTSRKGLEMEDMRARCRRLSAETANSRAALDAFKSKYDRLKAAYEEDRSLLLAAEKRLDRLRSRTVQALEARAAVKKPDLDGDGQDEPKSLSNVVTEEKADHELSTNNHAVPIDEAELTDLRQIIARRSKDLEETQASRLELQNAFDGLKLQLSNIPESLIKESVAYQRLESRKKMLENDLDRARSHCDAANREADSMREQQTDFRETAIRDACAQLEEVKQRLIKYESDLVRVRSQREDFKSEANELKARDTEKLRQVDQIRTLANSRQDRIMALNSEVRRLKMQLGAERGDLDMVQALALGESEEQVKEYQKRLKEAEVLALALRDQLRSYSSTSGTSDHNAITGSEIRVREELINVKARVAELEDLMSVDSGGAPDIITMAQKAKERDIRIKSLEASVIQRDQSMDMLMQEIDRLTAAWTMLDEQNRDKVLSLVTYEEKVIKLTTEKTKADNRYFTSMRKIETLQNEAGVHQKTVASQSKAIETLQQARTSLLARMNGVEKEVSLLQQNNRTYQDRISELESDASDKILQINGRDKQLEELTKTLRERTARAEQESSKNRHHEEQIAQLQREVTSAKATNKTVMRKGGVDEDLRQHNEELMKMLKCTSCNLRFKTHVITRCYHLLCKDCIEARINNRQRKCPTCAAPFGAQDYQQVYF